MQSERCSPPTATIIQNPLIFAGFLETAIHVNVAFLYHNRIGSDVVALGKGLQKASLISKNLSPGQLWSSIEGFSIIYEIRPTLVKNQVNVFKITETRSISG
jgi:hypothetical protein